MDRDKLISILERAKALIQAGWVQGIGATDAQGKHVPWVRKEATCFCLTAALARAETELEGKPPNGPSAAYRFLYRVFKDVTGASLMMYAWNDEPTRIKEDVIELYSIAIAKAMAKEEVPKIVQD